MPWQVFDYRLPASLAVWTEAASLLSVWRVIWVAGNDDLGQVEPSFKNTKCLRQGRAGQRGLPSLCETAQRLGACRLLWLDCRLYLAAQAREKFSMPIPRRPSPCGRATYILELSTRTETCI